MDYMSMISSVAGGMKDGSKQGNPEAQAMMNDVGAALDENDAARNKAYSDAFSNYMQASNQQLAAREQAAGAAANAAARAAGPGPGNPLQHIYVDPGTQRATLGGGGPEPGMATGVAMPAGGMVTPQQSLQAEMARAAMGQQNLGAPGPSAALSNVQLDPRTGLAVAGGGGGAPMAATPYPAVGAIYGGGQGFDDAALQAAYLRSRGMGG